MKFLIVTITSLLAAGCMQSSGVLKMGPDTYSIAVDVDSLIGGMTRSQKYATNDANAHCLAMRKEIVIIKSNTFWKSHYGIGTTEIQFMCLEQGDPELKRPKYRDSPNIIIENR